MTLKDKDKRRAPREKHDSVLEFFDATGEAIIGIGRLVNVSTTGACFSSKEDLKKGAKLKGRLRLLTRGVWEVTAHVVWRQAKTASFLYGIQFDSVEETRRERDVRKK